jgi:tetratricopeptide (TPR) repeat protein
MGREGEAEAEFRILTQNAPEDLLATTQLGFLLYARGEKLAAMPLFDRVLAATDDDLANRVRAVLRLPQVLRPRGAAAPQSIDAKIMAERSIKAGYMKDALKYLEAAHESDPVDFDVMRKLAWTNNILHRDAVAFRWFDLARRSPDPTIAADAEKGFRNLYAAAQRSRPNSTWV